MLLENINQINKTDEEQYFFKVISGRAYSYVHNINIVSIMCSLNKYLFNTNYMPGTMLNAWDTSVSNTKISGDSLANTF